MSFCQKCGSEIPNNSQVCPNCGAVTGEVTNLNAPVAPAQPSAPKKSNKALIGIIIAVAAVAVIAIVAVVLLLGGKSKNNGSNSTPSNYAPATQNNETENNKNTAANWYDGVWKDGDLTFKIPCTFREFFDATQTNNKEEAEEYFGGLKLEDIDRKTSYISDNYNEEDFEGEIYFDTDGATNMWDTTVEKIVFESYKDGKFDLVRLEPGIYIGMSKDEAVQLIGEPDKTETLSGGASDYYYNHGNMELILYLDSDGIVEKISLDCDNG